MLRLIQVHIPAGQPTEEARQEPQAHYRSISALEHIEQCGGMGSIPPRTLSYVHRSGLASARTANCGHQPVIEQALAAGPRRPLVGLGLEPRRRLALVQPRLVEPSLGLARGDCARSDKNL
jgi:hypothetical protein